MSWDWEKLREQQKKHGSGSDGNGPVPPQVDEIMKNFKGFNFPGALVILIVLVVLIWGKSMVYTIDAGTVGVVQRFGKYHRTEMAGLHFKLPDGVEKLTVVDSRKIRNADFGTRTNQTDESLMLTGDLNVGIVPWIVQYRIADPVSFLFKVRNPEGLLRDLSEASMRLVVGDRSIDEVINTRNEIAVACKEGLQVELDKAGTGIEVVLLELQKTNVPAQVQPSFNLVNKAEQERETMTLAARKDYNKALPAARGNATRMLREAEGYAIDRTNRASGDAERFKALYEEYVKAKDVTKRRLYLEMINEVYPKLGRKVIIDASQKNVLPFLNLGGEGKFPVNLNSK